ncbi:MAG: MFS transporter [Alphaproteobacteria bacterium]|nr:MFS transporter [Alphaproteobacteria bacterium]
MSTALAPLGRDLKVMGLVGTAHAASHFFHLVLPPLFPLLRTEFDLSYAALGLLTALFYGASGIAQTIAGFLVDRFGARRILLGGLILLSVSVTGYGFATEFWMLLVLSVLAGLGNSVFHPADLSILTSKVSPSRLGRAYGAHALCGYLGWAVAPGFVVAVASLADWRVAVIAAGLAGLAVVVLLVVWGGEDLAEAPAPPPVRRGTAGILRDVRLLLSPTILSCFAYFTFLSAALVGVQTFGLTAMQVIYSVTLQHATIALTAFLVGGAAGIFVGGFAADRTERHDVIAMSGVMLSAVVLVAIGAEMTGGGLLVPAIAMAGFLSGTTSPSRDMLVRKATPGGATGRVFGFVYSGLDLGSSLMPLLLGWLLDGGDPRIVFHGCAVAMVITMLTVFEVRRRGVIAAGRA